MTEQQQRVWRKLFLLLCNIKLCLTRPCRKKHKTFLITSTRQSDAQQHKHRPTSGTQHNSWVIQTLTWWCLKRSGISSHVCLNHAFLLSHSVTQAFKWKSLPARNTVNVFYCKQDRSADAINLKVGTVLMWVSDLSWVKQAWLCRDGCSSQTCTSSSGEDAWWPNAASVTNIKVLFIPSNIFQRLQTFVMYMLQLADREPTIITTHTGSPPLVKSAEQTRLMCAAVCPRDNGCWG